MKKILFAVLLATIIVGCKDDKFPGDNNDNGSGFKQKDEDPLALRTGGGPKSRDKFGPGEPSANSNANISCLWCSKSIDASASSKIVFNPLDSKAFPGSVPNSEFTNAHFCGFKCFNEFKSAYLNSSKIEIKFNDSSRTYKVLLSTK